MEFYVINKRPRGQADDELMEFYMDEHVKVSDPIDICPACKRFLGTLTTQPPYKVHLECRGRKFRDIAFGPGQEFLVSQRFKDLYEKAGLRGLVSFEPVEVLTTKGCKRTKCDPPNYYKTDVRHGPTRLDGDASGIRWITPHECDICLRGKWRSWERIAIIEDTWNGDDIFIALGRVGRLLVTPAFYKWAKVNSIQTLVFERAEECSYDPFPWKP